MADGQAFVGKAEDDLGGHDEAREANRMHLGTSDGGAPRLLRPMEILDRVPDLWAANPTEALRELACRPARNVVLGGACVVNDLPLRQMTRRKERCGLAH